MAREEIVITFDEDSPKVTVAAVGVIGPSCKALTRPFEEGLGILHSGTDTLKPEYHKVPLAAGLKTGGKP